jgi:hypothetical protein
VKKKLSQNCGRWRGEGTGGGTDKKRLEAGKLGARLRACTRTMLAARR